MSRTIAIIGLQKAKAKIQDLTDLRPAKKIVKKYTAKVQEKAQRKVPVITGTLKRSIMSAISEDGRLGIVAATAEYAEYVEYGTRYMDAKPFMRPSADEIWDDFQNELAEVVRDQARR